jgi:hypothetical protein
MNTTLTFQNICQAAQQSNRIWLDEKNSSQPVRVGWKSMFTGKIRRIQCDQAMADAFKIAIQQQFRHSDHTDLSRWVIRWAGLESRKGEIPPVVGRKMIARLNQQMGLASVIQGKAGTVARSYYDRILPCLPPDPAGRSSRDESLRICGRIEKEILDRFLAAQEKNPEIDFSDETIRQIAREVCYREMIPIQVDQYLNNHTGPESNVGRQISALGLDPFAGALKTGLRKQILAELTNYCTSMDTPLTEKVFQFAADRVALDHMENLSKRIQSACTGQTPSAKFPASPLDQKLVEVILRHDLNPSEIRAFQETAVFLGPVSDSIPKEGTSLWKRTRHLQQLYDRLDPRRTREERARILWELEQTDTSELPQSTPEKPSPVDSRDPEYRDRRETASRQIQERLSCFARPCTDFRQGILESRILPHFTLRPELVTIDAETLQAVETAAMKEFDQNGKTPDDSFLIDRIWSHKKPLFEKAAGLLDLNHMNVEQVDQTLALAFTHPRILEMILEYPELQNRPVYALIPLLTQARENPACIRLILNQADTLLSEESEKNDGRPIGDISFQKAWESIFSEEIPFPTGIKDIPRAMAVTAVRLYRQKQDDAGRSGILPMGADALLSQALETHLSLKQILEVVSDGYLLLGTESPAVQNLIQPIFNFENPSQLVLFFAQALPDFLERLFPGQTFTMESDFEPENEPVPPDTWNIHLTGTPGNVTAVLSLSVNLDQSVQVQSITAGTKGIFPVRTTGFPNPGNACFSNSSFQLLSAIPDLETAFGKELKAEPKETELQLERRKVIQQIVRQIVTLLKSGNSSDQQAELTRNRWHLEEMLRARYPEEFEKLSILNQQDAQEYMTRILDAVGYPTFQVQKAWTSGEAPSFRTVTESMQLISLPLEKDSIRENLDHYFSPETIEKFILDPDSDGYRHFLDLVNSETARRVEIREPHSERSPAMRDSSSSHFIVLFDIQKQEQIHSHPPGLIVHLKRFDMGLWGPQKISRPITVDPEINLRNDNGTIRRYIPVACVLHSGGTQGGHYTALKQHRDGWYLYNDAYTPKQTSTLSAFQTMSQYGYLVYYQPTEEPVPPDTRHDPAAPVPPMDRTAPGPSDHARYQSFAEEADSFFQRHFQFDPSREMKINRSRLQKTIDEWIQECRKDPAKNSLLPHMILDCRLSETGWEIGWTPNRSR